MEGSDLRASAPICTPAEVATLVRSTVPLSTVYSWMKATHTRPALIHNVEPEVRGWPRIPLIGLAEASVLRAMRDRKMKMPEIAAAVRLPPPRGRRVRARQPSPPPRRGSGDASKSGRSGDFARWSGCAAPDSGEAPPTVHARTRRVRSVLPRAEAARRGDRSSLRVGQDAFHENRGPRLRGIRSPRGRGSRRAVADEYELRTDEVELVRQHLPWLSKGRLAVTRESWWTSAFRRA